MLSRYKLQITPKFFLSILPLICLMAISIGFGVGIVRGQHQSHQHKILKRDL